LFVRNISLHSDTLSWFQPVFVITPQYHMLSREAANIISKVFWLTRSGLIPTIYCIQGKHSNNYIIDAVKLVNHTAYCWHGWKWS
jgi:hypothetical protein